MSGKYPFWSFPLFFWFTAVAVGFQLVSVKRVSIKCISITMRVSKAAWQHGEERQGAGVMQRWLYFLFWALLKLSDPSHSRQFVILACVCVTPRSVPPWGSLIDPSLIPAGMGSRGTLMDALDPSHPSHPIPGWAPASLRGQNPGRHRRVNFGSLGEALHPQEITKLLQSIPGSTGWGLERLQGWQDEAPGVWWEEMEFDTLLLLSPFSLIHNQPGEGGASPAPDRGVSELITQHRSYLKSSSSETWTFGRIFIPWQGSAGCICTEQVCCSSSTSPVTRDTLAVLSTKGWGSACARGDSGGISGEFLHQRGCPVNGGAPIPGWV